MSPSNPIIVPSTPKIIPTTPNIIPTTPNTVGVKKSNDTNCRCNLHLKQLIHQSNIKVGLLGL